MATPPLLKPPEQIPPSLEIARHVTEEEYAKARRQFIVLWSGTTLTPLLVGLIAAALGFLAAFGWLGMGGLIGLGVITYLVLYAAFPEARKISTLRLRKYKELQAWRTAKKKFEAEKTTGNIDNQ